MGWPFGRNHVALGSGHLATPMWPRGPTFMVFGYVSLRSFGLWLCSFGYGEQLQEHVPVRNARAYSPIVLETHSLTKCLCLFLTYYPNYGTCSCRPQLFCERSAHTVVYYLIVSNKWRHFCIKVMKWVKYWFWNESLKHNSVSKVEYTYVFTISSKIKKFDVKVVPFYFLLLRTLGLEMGKGLYLMVGASQILLTNPVHWYVVVSWEMKQA